MDRRMKPCAKCGHGKSLHLTHGCHKTWTKRGQTFAGIGTYTEWCRCDGYQEKEQTMSELTTDKALSFIADGLCDCMGTLEEHHTNGCPQDEVAVAWLTQVQREAAVKALREAADNMDARANKNELIALADRWEGYYSGVLSSILKETSALRARADRIEAEKLLLD